MGGVGDSAGATSRSAGACSSVPLNIFIKHIIMRQNTSISVGNIGGLPPIPHFCAPIHLFLDRWGNIGINSKASY